MSNVTIKYGHVPGFVTNRFPLIALDPHPMVRLMVCGFLLLYGKVWATILVALFLTRVSYLSVYIYIQISDHTIIHYRIVQPSKLGVNHENAIHFISISPFISHLKTAKISPLNWVEDMFSGGPMELGRAREPTVHNWGPQVYWKLCELDIKTDIFP